MLHPGIKLGPKDWLPRLDASKAEYVEVWYRADQPQLYTKMLRTLKERNVRFGLHFWAMTSSGHEPNLAYPGPERYESMELIRSCIEAASSFGGSYVNIHSGNRSLCRILFDENRLFMDTGFPVISDEESTASRNEALLQLGREARQVSVDFLVEAIPARLQEGNCQEPDSRLKTTESYPTSLSGILMLMAHGLIGFTNDLCHVFAMQHDIPREKLVRDAMALSVEYAPFTKVAHINTLTPPYNGTDAHLGILDHEFELKGIFPTRKEFSDFLSILEKQPHDVWLIGEPVADHLENFFALAKILQERKELGV